MPLWANPRPERSGWCTLVGKEEEMVRLSKNILLIFSVLFFISTFSFAEEITITTYYPSPYGSYKQLAVSGRDDSINVAGSNVGSIDISHPTSGGLSAITFKSTVNWPSDGGYLAYYDDNNSYNYWGDTNENSALVLGTTNDVQGSSSDVVVLRSQAAAIVDAPSLFVSPNAAMRFTGGGLGHLALNVGAYGANPANGIGLFVSDTTSGYVGWVGAIRSGNENCGGWGCKTLRFQVPDGSGGVMNALAIKGVTGNVGIGATAPDGKLDVRGSTYVGSNTSGGGIGDHRIKFTDAWTAFPDSTYGAEISNDTSAYQTLMLIGNRSAGLGRRVSVWDRFEVNGTAYSTSGTWTGSDARLKENIKTLPNNTLEKVLKLRGVSFQWKREKFKDKNLSEGIQIGLIAQEIEREFPELVSAGADGYKFVAYDRLSAILLEAIKAQQLEIDGLKARLDKLEGKTTQAGK